MFPTDKLFHLDLVSLHLSNNKVPQHALAYIDDFLYNIVPILVRHRAEQQLLIRVEDLSDDVIELSHVGVVDALLYDVGGELVAAEWD